MQTFIIYAVPSQGDSATPVMYLDADGIDGLPTAVRPYDPDDEQHAELASQLWDSVQRHPEFNTVGHIAVSYGGVTYADGSAVHRPLTTAEEARIIDNARKKEHLARARRRVNPRLSDAKPAAEAAPVTKVYTVLFSEHPTLAPMPDLATPVVWITGTEGLPPISITAVSNTAVAVSITEWARHEERQGRTVGEIIETFRGAHTWVVDGRIPESILSATPLEDADGIRANEDLIPQWEEAYEINVQAMQAATDFLQAAGEIRESLTYVPPHGLADWLSRNPEVLRGDDELPEHIHAAADVLEGLPAAILRDEVPKHYDGHAGEFLRASERVFRSVTKRLKRITPLHELDQD